jgi:hypothetical protein
MPYPLGTQKKLGTESLSPLLDHPTEGLYVTSNDAPSRKHGAFVQSGPSFTRHSRMVASEGGFEVISVGREAEAISKIEIGRCGA